MIGCFRAIRASLVIDAGGVGPPLTTPRAGNEQRQP